MPKPGTQVPKAPPPAPRPVGGDNIAAYHRVHAFAEVGSHGMPFMFEAGPMAERYPYLIQIYMVPGPGRVPCTILMGEHK